MHLINPLFYLTKNVKTNINNFFESYSKNINKDVLICSPVAGLEIETINKFIENRVIRIMPNLLISKKNGFIPFVKNYDDDHLGFIEIALSSVSVHSIMENQPNDIARKIKCV